MCVGLLSVRFVDDREYPTMNCDVESRDMNNVNLNQAYMNEHRVMFCTYTYMILVHFIYILVYVNINKQLIINIQFRRL